MPVSAPPAVPRDAGRRRPSPTLLASFALLGLLASCSPTDRLAQRRPVARQQHPRTVPVEKAPLFPGLRKASKRRVVAAPAPGARRPFTRGTSRRREVVSRKRAPSGEQAARASSTASAKTHPDGPAVTTDANPASAKHAARRHERRLRADIETAAASYTGIPYEYGGTTTEGFDCSGFTQYVMRDFGIALKRVSISQAQQGRAIEPKHAEPGDLVYFANERGRVNHVGIVVANGPQGLTMIHASSSRGIRRDNVTHSDYWRPRLAGVRCVVDCRAPSALKVKGPGVALN